MSLGCRAQASVGLTEMLLWIELRESEVSDQTVVCSGLRYAVCPSDVVAYDMSSSENTQEKARFSTEKTAVTLNRSL